MTAAEATILERINRIAGALLRARRDNEGSGLPLPATWVEQQNRELTTLYADLRRERVKIGLVR